MFGVLLLVSQLSAWSCPVIQYRRSASASWCPRCCSRCLSVGGVNVCLMLVCLLKGWTVEVKLNCCSGSVLSFVPPLDMKHGHHQRMTSKPWKMLNNPSRTICSRMWKMSQAHRHQNMLLRMTYSTNLSLHPLWWQSHLHQHETFQHLRQHQFYHHYKTLPLQQFNLTWWSEIKVAPVQGRWYIPPRTHLYIHMQIGMPRLSGIPVIKRTVKHSSGLGPLRINLHLPLLLGGRKHIHKYTSSTAQGGGGSFKNRKPIGEIDCCESPMTEQKHWWIELFNCV